MKVPRKGRATRRTVNVNPDLAGFAVAISLATVVMTLGFIRGVDGFELAFRVMLTFAISWATTFLCVLMFERVAARENAARKRAERAALAEARAREQEESEQEDSATGAGEGG